MIDPVLDFDLASGEADTRSAERDSDAGARARLANRLGAGDPRPRRSPLGARPTSRRKTGAAIGIGEHIREVQKIFRPMFSARRARSPTVGLRPPVQRRRALRDRRARGRGDAHARPHAGLRHLSDRRCRLRRRHAVHAGLRHGARRLSRRRRAHALSVDPPLLSLPAETRLFLCHDYKAPGRDDYRWETTVGEQRARRTSMSTTASARTTSSPCARRATPSCRRRRLLLPSIQVNIRAGRFPEAEVERRSLLCASRCGRKRSRPSMGLHHRSANILQRNKPPAPTLLPQAQSGLRNEGDPMRNSIKMIVIGGFAGLALAGCKQETNVPAPPRPPRPKPSRYRVTTPPRWSPSPAPLPPRPWSFRFPARR